MRRIHTKATLEPCTILEVYPHKFTALVRGERNLGTLEVTWCDYSCPGEFLKEDAHWGGRIPEKGAKVLVIAEWTEGDVNQVVRAYIIGYLPITAQRFSSDGYNAGRENISGPVLTGDHVVSTSARSYYKLSSTGNIVEECTPTNYRRRSPAGNVVYDVCENKHTHVSGFVERITYDEYGNRGNKYVRVLWGKLPKTSDFNDEAQRSAAISDAGNTVILEEFGSNVAPDFVCGENDTTTTPIYKFSIIKNGVAVYSKVIDDQGNVYEGNAGNRKMVVANNLTMLVTNTWYSVAGFMSWMFGAATSAVSGFGSGVWDFVASRINFRKY